jgi:transglutaminase-like putative cysteine protease
MGWRLRIRHVSGFTYAGTAHTSYNEARMTPLTLPGQTTLFSQVECHPSASTWRYWDYWGTQVTVFDLQRPHQQMRVTASSLAERAAALARDAPPAEAARAIAGWVRETVEYVPGSTGVRTSALDAWQLRQGVCQDIAQLTVGMLRSVGVPARYVSGYLYPQVDGAVGDTVAGQSHAWVDWWSGQWSGFDPTNGVPAGHRHVVVARGRDYADVTPLKGIYHGAPATGLGVTVEITRLA